MDKKYILFDLDGTITDSKLGITTCVQYALKDQGIIEEDINKLCGYIGPALDESFARFHGLTGDKAKKAVKKYRERYEDKGLYENEVYAGIEECLAALKEAGRVLALSTCKPEPFAIRILEYFNLDKYFTVITGSCLDGTRKHKNEVIEETFNRLCKELELDAADEAVLMEMKADAVMVGDRDQDVNGAHMAGIECIGVSYGYAEEEELEDAGVEYIVDTIPQLIALILSDTSC